VECQHAGKTDGLFLCEIELESTFQACRQSVYLPIQGHSQGVPRVPVTSLGNKKNKILIVKANQLYISQKEGDHLPLASLK